MDPVEPGRPAVVAATRLEARAARRCLPGADVFEVGIACARGIPSWEGVAIVVGLCGAMAELAPGTIAIPRSVSTPDGDPLDCDQAMVDRLVDGARSLGLRSETGPMLTSPALVTGDARQRWADLGFPTADMEAGLVLRRGPAAVVRVVLDTPDHELSTDWGHLTPATFVPARWGELLWLARTAPGAAGLAAEVVRAGLSSR
jgi:hypothetical protein